MGSLLFGHCVDERKNQTQLPREAAEGMKNGVADMKNASVIVSLGALLTVMVPSYAHHSFAADYDADKPATIEGIVTEFWFQNPHVRIYLEVENDNGEMEAWEVETSTVNLLRRMGWRPDTFVPGQKLAATGSLARNGSNRLSLQILVLEDGTEMRSLPTDQQREAFYEQNL